MGASVGLFSLRRPSLIKYCKVYISPSLKNIQKGSGARSKVDLHIASAIYLYVAPLCRSSLWRQASYSRSTI